jgi:hypothetical protein
MPPSSATDESSESFDKNPTYTILSAAHAVRQAYSLGLILAGHLHQLGLQCASTAIPKDYFVWLFDALLTLDPVLGRWHPMVPTSRIALIRRLLDVPVRNARAVDLALLRKGHTLLVLICGKVTTSPYELLDEEDEGREARQTYSIALVHLAEAALVDREIGRLASSQIVGQLETLSAEETALGPSTDIWVG